MDISRLYSTPYYSAAGKTAGGRCQVTMGHGYDYQEQITMEELMARNDTQYAGSDRRTTLSDAEIAVLANKYDPRNINREEYDDFLDDLVDMGVLSEKETQWFAYHSMIVMDRVDLDVQTHSVGRPLGSPDYDLHSPFLWDDETGDMVAWSKELTRWREGIWYDGYSQETEVRARKRYEMYGAVSDVINRMAAMRPDSGGRTEENKENSDIVNQFVDPSSALYRGLIEKLKEQARDAEEEKREQAVIDALSDVLDGLSDREVDGKKPNMALSTAKIGKLAKEYKPGDPRRVQLEQAVNQMNKLGIYLHTGGKNSVGGGPDSETLTQRLIREEKQDSNPSIFDLI